MQLQTKKNAQLDLDLSRNHVQSFITDLIIHKKHNSAMALTNSRQFSALLKNFRCAQFLKRNFGELSAEHRIIQSVCRDFAENELKPIAADLDKNSTFPHEKVKQLGDMGLLRMGTDRGTGSDTLSIAIAVDELSRGCASTGAIISIHNCLYVSVLNTHGTSRQKKEYLNSFAKGAIGCFALSEPNAGTNVADLNTTARNDGDYWIVNGSKSWVTSAYEGNSIVIFAKTDSSLKHKGITAFIVDKDTEGVTLGAKENLMGIRALTSCNVSFEDVKVHKDNILGNVGEGFKIAMAQLDQARIGIAAQALGIAQAALDCAVSYSLERKAFNESISQLPSVQNRLAEMAISLNGARLLTWKAAVEYDSGIRSTKHSSIAKVAASRCANFVADNCIQIMGGMGLCKDYPAERHYRDARVTQIYGGVTDIQLSIIAQQVINEYKNNK